jgi:hypothetical protein
MACYVICYTYWCSGCWPDDNHKRFVTRDQQALHWHTPVPATAQEGQGLTTRLQLGLAAAALILMSSVHCLLSSESLTHRSCCRYWNVLVKSLLVDGGNTPVVTTHQQALYRHTQVPATATGA